MTITEPRTARAGTLAGAPVPSPAATTHAPGFEFDVAIVGLGYVGLPTALGYFAAGRTVLAYEISTARTDSIRTQDVDLLDSDRERLSEALGDPAFHLTNEPADLARAAAVVVCVPTPVDRYLIPDLVPLRSASTTVVAHAVVGQLLMLTSTSYVGSTRDMLVGPLSARGFQVGHDVFVAYSPERIDPGNAAFGHEEVPRVVGGASPECEERAASLISATTNVHRVHSLEAAEMAKLLENTFRAVNIALINEVADACRSLDVDVIDVIDAAATKPYGFMAFNPGPGVGGHCIPCDSHYLLWQLRGKRLSTPVITSAMGDIAARPGQVVDRVREILSDDGRGIVGARVLVVGVAYKPNVADHRESPALEILARLHRMGATIAYHDDLIPSVRVGADLVVLNTADPAAFDADLVVIHTRHSSADLSWISPDHLVLDTTYRQIDIAGRKVL